MSAGKLNRSVYQVTSSDPQSNVAGSAFVIGKDKDSDSYLLVTCWHVVEDIGSKDLRILDKPVELVSTQPEYKTQERYAPDLAVLKVARTVLGSNVIGLKVLENILIIPKDEERDFVTYGYSDDGTARTLEGVLKKGQDIKDNKNFDFIHYDYKLDDKNELDQIEEGYSGSPVVVDGEVAAVVTHGNDDNFGFAVSISYLKRVYKGPVQRLDKLEEPEDNDMEPEYDSGPIADDIDLKDIKDEYVYRARFQPFCKDHYEAIQGFWCRYVKPRVEDNLNKANYTLMDLVNGKIKAIDAYVIDAAPDLYLWVVKTLSTTAYNMGKLNTVGGELFRHISIFNPFSFMECQKIIRKDMYYFIEKELEAFSEDEHEDPVYIDLVIFKTWILSHLHVVSIPFTIEQMQKYWDSDTSEDDKGWIFGDKDKVDKGTSEFIKIFNTLYRETKRGLQTSNIDQSVNEMALNLATRFKDTSCQVVPPMYLPIFDQQDKIDFTKLSIVKWTKEVCYRPWVDIGNGKNGGHLNNLYFKTGLKEDNDNRFLCAQNAFIYLVFLLLIQYGKTDQSLIDKVKNEKDRLNIFLECRSTPETVKMFEGAAEELIKSVNPANIKKNGRLKGVEGDIIESLSLLGLPTQIDKFNKIYTIRDGVI